MKERTGTMSEHAEEIAEWIGEKRDEDGIPIADEIRAQFVKEEKMEKTLDCNGKDWVDLWVYQRPDGDVFVFSCEQDLSALHGWKLLGKDRRSVERIRSEAFAEGYKKGAGMTRDERLDAIFAEGFFSGKNRGRMEVAEESVVFLADPKNIQIGLGNSIAVSEKYRAHFLPPVKREVTVRNFQLRGNRDEVVISTSVKSEVERLTKDPAWMELSPHTFTVEER